MLEADFTLMPDPHSQPAAPASTFLMKRQPPPAACSMAGCRAANTAAAAASAASDCTVPHRLRHSEYVSVSSSRRARKIRVMPQPHDAAQQPPFPTAATPIYRRPSSASAALRQKPGARGQPSATCFRFPPIAAALSSFPSSPATATPIRRVTPSPRPLDAGRLQMPLR